jgi:hypothetical protein
MAAIPPAERENHRRATRRLVASATSIQETPDGVAFQLAAGDYAAAAEFVSLERLCCPFLRFELGVTPGKGPVWLRIIGPPGAGAFLRLELELP